MGWKVLPSVPTRVLAASGPTFTFERTAGSHALAAPLNVNVGPLLHNQRCGCGTGAFAEQVLAAHLPAAARYVVVDSSPTMARLAQTRLARFGSRVVVQHTDGSLQFAAASSAFDRFVATYVADLLSAADIAALLHEAHRLLTPEGRLCLVSLTHGFTWGTRMVTGLWTRVHARWPQLVGGCRPLDLREVLPATLWLLTYCTVIVAFGIPSEIVIAGRRPGAR